MLWEESPWEASNPTSLVPWVIPYAISGNAENWTALLGKTAGNPSSSATIAVTSGVVVSFP
jgi:hypothetical protein